MGESGDGVSMIAKHAAPSTRPATQGRSQIEVFNLIFSILQANLQADERKNIARQKIDEQTLQTHTIVASL
jgi:hypothetical protein